jgi:hypothetical protein
VEGNILIMNFVAYRLLGGDGMDEIVLLDGSRDGFLYVCKYCGRHRDERGYWEEAPVSSESFPEEKKVKGKCPQCLKEHFPALYSSLYQGEKVDVEPKPPLDSPVVRKCYFIVNNIGFLSGDYDREQLL